MQVAIYTRASLDRTGEGAAVARQSEDADKLAQLRGWTVVARHQDNDISAAGKKRRPGFEALLADIVAGRVQAVIAWDLTRLTRNRRDTIRLIETCEEKGVIVALVRGSDIDMSTPAGRLVADVLSGVARHEIDQKGDRQRRAQQQAAEQGRPAGGRRAFGYSRDGKTIVESEARHVRVAYADLLAGRSLKGIAREWNESGQTTTAGNPWRHDNVREVLKNARYAGLRTYRGEIVSKAIWEPVIDIDTFESARSLLAMPARRTTVSLARKWLLPGLAHCRCGSDVATGHTRHGKRVYSCRSSKHVSRAAQPVDAFIAGGTIDRVLVEGVTQYDVTTHGVVVERMSRPDAIALVVNRQGPDLAPDRARAGAIRERLDDLATGLEEGILTLYAVRQSSGRLRAELAEVQARLDAAAQVDVLGPLAEAEGIEATAAVWASYDLLQRREVIDTLMTITLLSPKGGRQAFDPTTVAIEWKS